MANDDRKQRILQHLKESTAGVQYSAKKTTKPSPEPFPSVVEPNPSLSVVEPKPSPVVVPPVVQTRKQKVMNHVKLSSEKFGDFSLDTPDSRKKQIEDHLKKSLG
ncbi:MAG: hypothetical protein AB4041_07980 [Microcystaceae cyanobacterium]